MAANCRSSGAYDTPDDVNRLHALVREPLVYHYLFDGAAPDPAFIEQQVTQGIGRQAETLFEMCPRRSGEATRWLRRRARSARSVASRPLWCCHTCSTDAVSRDMLESHHDQTHQAFRQLAHARRTRVYPP